MVCALHVEAHELMSLYSFSLVSRSMCGARCSFVWLRALCGLIILHNVAFVRVHLFKIYTGCAESTLVLQYWIQCSIRAISEIEHVTRAIYCVDATGRPMAVKQLLLQRREGLFPAVQCVSIVTEHMLAINMI